MPTSSISMAKRQAALEKSGFLDLTGDSKINYQAVSFDAVSQALEQAAIDYVKLARDKLNEVDRVASGALSDSIIPTSVEVFGKIYRVNINIASYYKFVDQGVKGWADEKGGNSPYQFKKYSKGGGNGKGSMVTAIRKWLIKEGLKGKGKENAHPKASKRDRFRASITDTSTRTAIIISRAIRKKGLKPSHFWTYTEKEMRIRIREKFAKALKVDVINNLIP